MSILSASPANAGGLLSRIFGGRRQQLQSVSCHQQVAYQQPVYYQQQYQPQVVAALPLVAVANLNDYVYSVNPSFATFRQYQAQQYQATQAQQPPEAVNAGRETVGPVGSVVDSTGPAVLAKNCISCHQAGRQPKAGFAILDERGQLNPGLPYEDMLERITSQDPQTRMPPGKTLAGHEVMAVFRAASEQRPTERVASNPPARINPFE